MHKISQTFTFTSFRFTVWPFMNDYYPKQNNWKWPTWRGRYITVRDSSMGWLQQQGDLLQLLHNTMITITLIINVINPDCNYSSGNNDYSHDYNVYHTNVDLILYLYLLGCILYIISIKLVNTKLDIFRSRFYWQRWKPLIKLSSCNCHHISQWLSGCLYGKITAGQLSSNLVYTIANW